MIGSLIAALVGVALNVYQAKLKEDKPAEKLYGTEASQHKDTIYQFSLIHHTSLALCAVISPAFFETELSAWAWIIALINILGKLCRHNWNIGCANVVII